MNVNSANVDEAHRQFSRDSTEHIDAVHRADNEKLLSLNELNIRKTRPRVIALFLFVGLYCIVGVAAFHNADGWSDLDSIYFSVVTLATIGYGDYVPTTNGQKIFVCFFVVIGISICVCFLAFFRLLLDSRIAKDHRLMSLKTMYMIEESLNRTRSISQLGNREHERSNISPLSVSHSSSSSSSTHHPKASPDSFYGQMNMKFAGLRSYVWNTTHNPTQTSEPSANSSLDTIRSIYENKYQDDVVRAWQRVCINFLWIFIVVFFGALVMSFVESWSGVDGAYWAVITICTVGYGDVVPTTNSGKVFTIFYVFLGCGVMARAIEDLATVRVALVLICDAS
jgi:voltage-gated potassium channel